MSRYRKYGFPELPFGIYVPSAILKDGSLIISWATGQPATTEIDWGFDQSVPNSRGPVLTQPGDENYVEGEDVVLLRRYHEIPFPQVFVDTTHFFRVRSSNAEGELLESEVLRVYIPETLFTKSKNVQAGIRLNVMTIDHTLAVDGSGIMRTSPTAQLPIGGSQNVGTEAKAEKQTIDKQAGTPNQKTTIKTNYTITIE